MATQTKIKNQVTASDLGTLVLNLQSLLGKFDKTQTYMAYGAQAVEWRSKIGDLRIEAELLFISQQNRIYFQCHIESPRKASESFELYSDGVGLKKFKADSRGRIAWTLKCLKEAQASYKEEFAFLRKDLKQAKSKSEIKEIEREISAQKLSKETEKKIIAIVQKLNSVFA